MRNQREWEALQADIKLWQAKVLPITEAISARAVSLVEKYFRSHHLQLADALVAATALEHQMPLATSNVKHFKAIAGLKLKPFKVE
jgi:predicted nucleic acid-binding protein